MIGTFSTVRRVATLTALTLAVFGAALCQGSDAQASAGCLSEFEVRSSIGGDIMYFCYQGSYWANSEQTVYYQQFRQYSWGTGTWSNMRKYVGVQTGRVVCFADALGSYRQLSWCDF